MHQARRISRGGESGIGLIELMAAIFILGIVLTAVAASLITFTRSASNSERRVQATALLNSLHEDFQALPFELAGIRTDEVGDLDGFAELWTAAPPAFTFDGRPGVVIVEDCDASDVTCRRSPRAYEEVVVNDREAYAIFQAVTWVDRSGDGVPDSKRLTSQITWTWLGQSTVETFESELTPVAPEVAEPDAPTLSLIVTPVATVDVDNQLEAPIQVSAIPSIPVSGVTVSFARWEWFDPASPTSGTLTTEPLALTEDDALPGLLFTGQIDVSLNGSPTLLPVGSLRIDAVAPTDPPSTVPAELEGRRTITVVGGGRTLVELEGGEEDPTPPVEPNPDLEPPPENVSVSTVSASRASVAYNPQGFRCELVIEALVSGLTPTNGFVDVTYLSSVDGTRTVAMAPVGAVVSAGTLFSVTLGTSTDHGITTDGARVFTIVAQRIGPGAQSDLRQTTPINFVQSGNCSNA